MAKLKRIFLGGYKSYPIRDYHGFGLNSEILPMQDNVPDEMYLTVLTDGYGLFTDKKGQIWQSIFPTIDQVTDAEWQEVWDYRKHEISDSNEIILDDIFMSLKTLWLETEDFIKEPRFFIPFVRAFESLNKKRTKAKWDNLVKDFDKQHQKLQSLGQRDDRWCVDFSWTFEHYKKYRGL